MIDVMLVLGALTCINLNIYLVYLNRIKRHELERAKEIGILTSYDADPVDILAATAVEETSLWQ
jgi:hypothetical protein